MALTNEDKKEIERIVKKEVKDFLDTTKAHDVVIIVDLSTKVVVELFKTLWQRKGFWESAIKNVR
jgi:O-acetyl-ADP-ribose deacetylase (regulator of RNase III)